jgi:hypothetical protein
MSAILTYYIFRIIFTPLAWILEPQQFSLYLKILSIFRQAIAYAA